MLELDHLAVSCTNLEAGAEWVERHLGIEMQPGGKHALFGTHNRLLGMVDGLYLEVIAVDPEAPAPGRSRWFDLDHFTGAPRLSNWICRCNALAQVAKHLPEAGEAVALSRGDLHWRMAVPEDGRLPFDQMHPAIIEWQRDQAHLHPAKVLARGEIRLHRLHVIHPEAAALRKLLQGLFDDPRVEIERGNAPRLRAEFLTPSGRRVL